MKNEILTRLLSAGHITLDELLVLAETKTTTIVITSLSELDSVIEKVTRGSRAIAN